MFMTSNKREIERAKLHKTIWGLANSLRGAVDGWDFKAYILGMLFYRYISENVTRRYLNEHEQQAGKQTLITPTYLTKWQKQRRTR